MWAGSFAVSKTKSLLSYNLDLRASIALVGLDTERTSILGYETLRQVTEGTRERCHLQRSLNELALVAESRRGGGCPDSASLFIKPSFCIS